MGSELLIRVVLDNGVTTASKVYKAVEHDKKDPYGIGRYISLLDTDTGMSELVDCRYMKNYTLRSGAIGWLKSLYGKNLKRIELFGACGKWVPVNG